LIPVVAIEANLITIESPRKSPCYLGLLMACEAKNREVRHRMIARVVINVVDLDRLTGLPTHTAGTVC